MKTIFLMFVAVMLVSCEKQAPEADVNDAREKIARMGSAVGYAMDRLEQSTEPGKVALATEELRENRQKLEREIKSLNRIIPREEAEKIASINEQRSRENIKQWRAEDEARSEALRKEATETVRAKMEAIKSEYQKDPFEGRFVLPE
jgi:hypothetical protein